MYVSRQGTFVVVAAAVVVVDRASYLCVIFSSSNFPKKE
jgi:hypothetical protein